VRNLIFNKL